MNILDFLKGELTKAEAMERAAEESAKIAQQYIANHARLQVVVAHLRSRVSQEAAAPPTVITRAEANAACNRDGTSPLPEASPPA